jgi:hypothetical protein
MLPPPPFTRSLAAIWVLLLAWLAPSSLLRAQALPSLSGLSVSLSTSTHQVEASPEALLNPRRHTLAAQIHLRNRSRSPLLCQFATLEDARTKFTFTVFNASDTAVWTGSARPPARAQAPDSTTQVLRPHSAWTASVLIPLAPSGAWLPAGAYRVEAVLSGSPSIFAAASFEITAPPDTTTPPPLHSSTLVSGLDHLSAWFVTNPQGRKTIRVSASGWVPHPGYSNPRLEIPAIIPLILHADGSGILFLNFVVSPPSPNGAYPQVISNVSASLDIPWTNQSSVQVQTASGSQSVPVSDTPPPSTTRFPIHWGPPPLIQTMDIVELPGGYGMGSSTLAHWIRRQLDADASRQPR